MICENPAKQENADIPSLDVQHIKKEVNDDTDFSNEAIYKQPELFVDGASFKVESENTLATETDFICMTCGVQLKDGKELQQHTLVHESSAFNDTVKEVLRPHTCHTCEKRFTFKAALKRHLMIHTGCSQNF